MGHPGITTLSTHHQILVHQTHNTFVPSFFPPGEFWMFLCFSSSCYILYYSAPQPPGTGNRPQPPKPLHGPGDGALCVICLSPPLSATCYLGGGLGEGVALAPLGGGSLCSPSPLGQDSLFSPFLSISKVTTKR